LHPAVPSHLDKPCRVWVYQALAGGGTQLVAVGLEIPIDYGRAGGEAWPDAEAWLHRVPSEDLDGPCKGAVCKTVGFSKGPSEDPRRGLTAESGFNIADGIPLLPLQTLRPGLPLGAADH